MNGHFRSLALVVRHTLVFTGNGHTEPGKQIQSNSTLCMNDGKVCQPRSAFLNMSIPLFCRCGRLGSWFAPLAANEKEHKDYGH